MGLGSYTKSYIEIETYLNQHVVPLTDLNDYDEGRAKIVEYLYNEYSLEEILYKLAKV